MKYVIDHDYHIHSKLSLCSNHDGQTTQAILNYAKANDFKRVCLTDHFWDENIPGAIDWYKQQGFKHIGKALPLPKDDEVKFYFGCETDMDKHYNIGISSENFDKFDFIIVSTTHFHMKGFTINANDTFSFDSIAKQWIARLDALLEKKLPFHKIGIAHLTCGHITEGNNYLKVIDCISDEEFNRIFKKVADYGCGIELNFNPYNNDELIRELRPYNIAKECGCKFYFGSDSHRPADFEGKKKSFEYIANCLNLKESDKFYCKG